MADDREDLLRRIDYLERQVSTLTGISVFAFVCLSALGKTVGVDEEFWKDLKVMSDRVDEALDARKKHSARES